MGHYLAYARILADSTEKYGCNRPKSQHFWPLTFHFGVVLCVPNAYLFVFLFGGAKMGAKMLQTRKPGIPVNSFWAERDRGAK